MTSLEHNESEPPELLAPAGDRDCARAAVENGADAVYFGLDRGFNARARATNIDLDSLADLMAMLHRRGVRGYVTLNTLVFSDELAEWERTVVAVARAGVDAILVQDLGVATLARQICPELPLHASTQMTITSAECLAAVEPLGLDRVVLARELSIGEIAEIRRESTTSIEAFAHGALCVAYSGQCMTSESLGGRSANRGQCAQACRLPYQLVCDGRDVDLGDMQYLLSPQDLAAHALIPEMLGAGVRSFKIEGRLKTADYVANVTQKYRRALDTAWEDWCAGNGVVSRDVLSAAEVEEMELSFSRGFSPGWLQGCDHKMLVPALSSAKRGVRLGVVQRVRRDAVEVRLCSASTEIRAGDGVAFADGDASHDDTQGGRVYEVRSTGGEVVELRFGNDRLDLRQLSPGMDVWKSDDPQLTRRLRATYQTKQPRWQLQLDLNVTARSGEPMRLAGRVYRGSFPTLLATACVVAEQALEPARKHSLTVEVLSRQLGRLGGTAFTLRELECELAGEPMAPLSLLNQLRQQLIAALDERLAEPPQRTIRAGALADMRHAIAERARPQEGAATLPSPPQLTVLCRSLYQLQVALEAGCDEVLVELQDMRQIREAVATAGGAGAFLWIATPRIQKPGEIGIFHAIGKQLALAPNSTGVLVRNLAGLRHFRWMGAPLLGDFSLNAANELTVDWLMQSGLNWVTASYDLNRDQLAALIEHCPPQWLEVVIHQHMPMFHMEHCVFCSVLSPGTDKSNCGRPCDVHQVRLRDRVGKEHRLHADVGCRNTLYNATPQSAAEIVPRLRSAGVSRFRVELLDDAPEPELREILTCYRELLAGNLSGREVWTRLQASNRVGVTRGALEQQRDPLAIL
ncbi:MAG: U32 family peptidase [Planctomycetales bacterium]|nr:U32 family peptidase [Planctomycetales bacterium]